MDKSSTLPEVQDTLDTRGLYCPEPIMLLHDKMGQLEKGDCLLVLASDPATQRDIPKFCQFLQQRLLQQKETQEEYHYWIEKTQS